MTVKHLRNLQRQQMSGALASDPNVVSKYRAGFKECAGEVVRYLNTSQSVNEDMRSRIMNHLSGVVPSMNAPSQHQQVTAVPVTPVTKTHIVHPQPQNQTQLQPLSVQIPHQQHAQNNNNNSSSSSSSCSSNDSFNVTSSPVQQNTCLLMPQQQTNSQQQHMFNNQSSPTYVNIAAPVNIDNKTQISGSFQILPGNMYNGPVAVYVGPVNDNQCSPTTTALPVFTVQVPSQQQLATTDVSPLSKNKENVYTKDFGCQDYGLKAKQAELLSLGHVKCLHSNVYNERLWRPW